MTVAELRERMTAQEYVEWSVYFGRKAQREQMEMRRAHRG